MHFYSEKNYTCGDRDEETAESLKKDGCPHLQRETETGGP